MVGSAKAAIVGAEIALRKERRIVRNKKEVEAAARKKLQEAHLTEERGKKNA